MQENSRYFRDDVQQCVYFRRRAAVLLGAALLLVVAFPWTGYAQTRVLGAPTLRQGRPGRPISLRDRLVSGLKARLKSEIAFVDAVVEAVHEGRIPQRLVDQTFFWARDRANLRYRWGRERRPIIYFQPAMRARAARLGMSL